MSEEQFREEAALIPLRLTVLSYQPSRLIQRGLETLNQSAVTLDEQIRTVRSKTREFKGLSNEAIGLTIENPPGWRALLFFQVMNDEIIGYESMRLAIELGVATGESETLEIAETRSWIMARLSEIMPIMNRLYPVLENLNCDAGVSDQSDNPIEIVLNARKTGWIYKQMLDLSARVMSVNCDPIFRDYCRACAEVVLGVAIQIEEFGIKSINTIKEVVKSALAASEVNKTYEINLPFTPHLDFEKAIIEQEKVPLDWW